MHPTWLLGWPQPRTPIRIAVNPQTTYVVELEQSRRGRIASLAPDPAVTASDIRYGPERNLLMARIHIIGSVLVTNLDVVFYEGDPQDGGREMGRTVVPNNEAPKDLEPRSVTVGVNWNMPKGTHDVNVVVNPEDHINGEITTFNNSADIQLEWRKPNRSYAEI
ncbi:MAG: hypothetical protein AB7I48_18275 [Planctomycetaceae bacterium]